MKIVRLTDEEAQILINFLDVAVKSIGLNAAQSAYILASKIQNAEDAPVQSFHK